MLKAMSERANVLSMRGWVSQSLLVVRMTRDGFALVHLLVAAEIGHD